MRHFCGLYTMKLNRLRTPLIIIALILVCPAVFIGYLYWKGSRWDVRVPFDEDKWRHAWQRGDKLECFYMRHSLCMWLDAHEPDALKVTRLLGQPTQVMQITGGEQVFRDTRGTMVIQATPGGRLLDLASSESRYDVALLHGNCYYDFGLLPTLTLDEPCYLRVAFKEGRYVSSSFEHNHLPSVLQHLSQ